MALWVSLLLGCPATSGGRWGQETEPAPSDGWFHPTEWAFEAWGYYDGETLGEFRYYGNSSGAVPAYMSIYLLGPGLMCTWIGAIQVEGLAPMQDEQWAGFAVSLSMTETDCDRLDPEEWGATNPSPLLDGLFLGLGWKDLTVDMEDQILDHVGSEGWTWEKEYEDSAFTQLLGLYDQHTGTWASHDVGPAFTYLTSEDGVLDLALGELKKVARGDSLQTGVVSGFTLSPRPISEITPF